jgi:hypothetical protein
MSFGFFGAMGAAMAIRLAAVADSVGDAIDDDDTPPPVTIGPPPEGIEHHPTAHTQLRAAMNTDNRCDHCPQDQIPHRVAIPGGKCPGCLEDAQKAEKAARERIGGDAA